MLKSLDEEGVMYCTNLFNHILTKEKMPDRWHKSFVVSIFKYKGDITTCANYCLIKLTSHAMKVWEKIIEKAHAWNTLTFGKINVDLCQIRSTTDAIFALQIFMERVREKR